VNRRTRIVVLLVAWLLYLGAASLALLEAFAGLMMNAYCDNCSPDDIAKIDHPVDVTIGWVAVTFIVGVGVTVWWLRRPA
jgi:hypothetical protein